MKKTILLTAMAALLVPLAAKADHIWINELHYDNTGTDTGEFVEVGLRTPNMSGFSFTDYSIFLYNGNGGGLYGLAGGYSLDPAVVNSGVTKTVSGPFPIMGSTSEIRLYTLVFPSNGLQNGGTGTPPNEGDGLALVNITNNTVEAFYAYEQAFTATAGPASGLTATLLPVFEPGDATGTSIGASGSGTGANQFNAASFTLQTASPGALNNGQTFAIPEPTTAVLLLGGAGILTLLRRRRS